MKELIGLHARFTRSLFDRNKVCAQSKASLCFNFLYGIDFLAKNIS